MSHFASVTPRMYTNRSRSQPSIEMSFSQSTGSQPVVRGEGWMQLAEKLQVETGSCRSGLAVKSRRRPAGRPYGLRAYYRSVYSGHSTNVSTVMRQTGTSASRTGCPRSGGKAVRNPFSAISQKQQTKGQSVDVGTPPHRLPMITSIVSKQLLFAWKLSISCSVP